MTTVTVTDTFDAPAERVWPMISDFGGIEKYMRGIDSLRMEGEGLGADRVIGLAGGVVVERLTWLDPEALAYSYTIISGPIPVDRYVATVKLTPEGQRCAIEWTGHFEPDGVTLEEAQKFVRGIYTGGIKGYKKALEG
jgi:uncharacterized protein YndB with AHSA1/START domain